MSCILCGGEDKELLTDTLRYGTKRNVFYCPDCDFGYLDSVKVDQDNYKSGSYRDKHGPVLGRHTRPEEAFEIYSRAEVQHKRVQAIGISKGKTLLEVGCSVGAFLSCAGQVYEECVGIELNEEEAEYAEQKTGCKVYRDSSKLEEEYFDKVCMFQVLEHVQNPVEFIKEYCKYLKPGGDLIIEVPSLDDALLSYYGVEAYKEFYFHKYHSWYFSRKSLLKALDLAGSFDEVLVKYSQDYNIFNHMNWIQNGKPQTNSRQGLHYPDIKKNRLLGVRNSESVGVEIVRNFFHNVIDNYKAMLERKGLASNILIIARKVEDETS